MRFSIITPTYRRADKLARAVASVQAQTYADWEMIIVNDSPDDGSYRGFASSISDPRIRYHLNPSNKGVNFARNHALDKLSAESKWVLFLDDDDNLAPDALQALHGLVLSHRKQNWFITNRAYKNGNSVLQVKVPDTHYSYAWEYLLLRKIKGDATHAISTACIHRIRFSRRVKQGEEWLFFYQLGLTEKMFYHNHNSTITDGYDVVNGLNFRKRTRGERFGDICHLLHEGGQRGFGYQPTFLLYLAARLVRLIK